MSAAAAPWFCSTSSVVDVSCVQLLRFDIQEDENVALCLS